MPISGWLRKDARCPSCIIPEQDDACALAIIAPLTSKIREMRGEVDLGKPKWLPKRSAVSIQGLASFDRRKLTRKWGVLTNVQLDSVKDAIRDLLNL